MLAAELWGDLIALLPSGSRSHALAWNAWPTAALAGPVLVMAAALLTAGPELGRLGALQA